MAGSWKQIWSLRAVSQSACVSSQSDRRIMKKLDACPRNILEKLHTETILSWMISWIAQAPFSFVLTWVDTWPDTDLICYWLVTRKLILLLVYLQNDILTWFFRILFTLLLLIAGKRKFPLPRISNWHWNRTWLASQWKAKTWNVSFLGWRRWQCHIFQVSSDFVALDFFLISLKVVVNPKLRRVKFLLRSSKFTS